MAASRSGGAFYVEDVLASKAIGPSGTARQSEKYARKRDEILAVARRLFTENGLSGTSIAQIAAAANLSHGLMYHYFESKDAVYFTITRESLRLCANINQDSLAEGSSGYDSMERLCEKLVAFAQSDPQGGLAVSTYEKPNVFPSALEVVLAECDAAAQLALETLTAILQRGMDDGSVTRKDLTADQLGLSLYGFMRGALYLAVIHRIVPGARAREVDISYLKQSLKLILEMLRPPVIEN